MSGANDSPILANIRWARLQAQDLGHKTDAHILLVISTFGNETGGCWPGIRKIAKEAGRSKGVVSESITRLVGLGLLSRTRTRSTATTQLCFWAGRQEGQQLPDVVAESLAAAHRASESGRARSVDGRWAKTSGVPGDPMPGVPDDVLPCTSDEQTSGVPGDPMPGVPDGEVPVEAPGEEPVEVGGRARARELAHQADRNQLIERRTRLLQESAVRVASDFAELPAREALEARAEIAERFESFESDDLIEPQLRSELEARRAKLKRRKLDAEVARAEVRENGQQELRP